MSGFPILGFPPMHMAHFDRFSRIRRLGESSLGHTGNLPSPVTRGRKSQEVNGILGGFTRWVHQHHIWLMITRAGWTPSEGGVGQFPWRPHSGMHRPRLGDAHPGLLHPQEMEFAPPFRSSLFCAITYAQLRALLKLSFPKVKGLPCKYEMNISMVLLNSLSKEGPGK